MGYMGGSYCDIRKLRGTIGFGSWGLGVGASDLGFGISGCVLKGGLSFFS